MVQHNPNGTLRPTREAAPGSKARVLEVRTGRVTRTVTGGNMGDRGIVIHVLWHRTRQRASSSGER